jgi:hypothetical protein
MDNLNSDWQRKGATLSDKTARKEFGLIFPDHQITRSPDSDGFARLYSAEPCAA